MRNYAVDDIVRFKSIMEGICSGRFTRHRIENFTINDNLKEILFGVYDLKKNN